MLGPRGNHLCFLGLLVALAAGCATARDRVQQALMHKKALPPADPTDAQPYRTGCPDVLDIRCEGRPELTSEYEVQANGCIDFGAIEGVRVEGLTLEQVQARIAEVARLPEKQVQVAVAHYRSQLVYLFGQVNGKQRAVPYQGPETITDLLRRVGGITEDGAPAEVTLVRNPLMESPNPEVYRVDLQAILMERDHRTNLMVQPYDQIHVGETKQARVEKCLHPLLRPLSKFVGWFPKREKPNARTVTR